MKFRWRLQGSASIVILDGDDNSIQVLKPLFSDVGFLFIDPNRVFSLLTPMLLMRSLWYFFLSGSVKIAYTTAFLSIIRPRIVITYIDNSIAFQGVARLLHGSMRFLAIQNGVRMLSRDNPPGSKKIFHSEFACFGEYDVSQFNNSGAEVLHFYPIGSLRDSYYRSYRKSLPLRKKYDVCLVSQIKPQHYKYYPKTMKSLELLAGYLKRFCDIHNKSLCIAARRQLGDSKGLFDWEAKWYRQYLGDSVNIIPNDNSIFNSYTLVDESHVSVALHTTMLHEGFGRYCRILACNFTNDDRYDFPVAGIWRLSDRSYEAFECALLRLLSISDEDYSKLAGTLPEYLIGYDQEYPTHTFLKQLIVEAVDGLPAPFITPRS